MWCHSLYYNTKHFHLGKGVEKIEICSYCGKQIEYISEFHDRDEKRWYHCFCEKASQQRKIQKLILELQWKTEQQEIELLNKIPDIDKGLINRIKYEYELTKLKQDYGYEDEKILFRNFG